MSTDNLSLVEEPAFHLTRCAIALDAAREDKDDINLQISEGLREGAKR